MSLVRLVSRLSVGHCGDCRLVRGAGTGDPGGVCLAPSGVFESEYPVPVLCDIILFSAAISSLIKGRLPGARARGKPPAPVGKREVYPPAL